MLANSLRDYSFLEKNVPHERSEVVMHPLTVIPEDSDLSIVCHETFIREGENI
jgi:hypothetical protein